jgi:hypothetical protein
MAYPNSGKPNLQNLQKESRFFGEARYRFQAEYACCRGGGLTVFFNFAFETRLLAAAGFSFAPGFLTSPAAGRFNLGFRRELAEEAGLSGSSTGGVSG